MLDLEQWLRGQCQDYRFDLRGVFRRDSEMAVWPVHAADAAELEARLASGGHILPLPKEPAALANVLEVSIVDFVLTRLRQIDGAEASRGSERGYPDLEISGAAFGGGFHAIDVKCARRSASGNTTQSAITLYTGNTYFRHPTLHWPGVPRPFDDYVSHLDLIAIYTLRPDLPHRVDDLEIIVQEPWRIASRSRSSKTREYIGAVKNIDDLRLGRGAFETPAAFYGYWRRFHFTISQEVQRQYELALEATRQELAAYRAASEGTSTTEGRSI
ncbi:type II restriction endonuclease [Phytohabitans sp. ZYX-F-186]|uniref:Type II restriction endonuclease n=1 Tax=Phytohabitans maris TaxID=3071409 RepID=A0ABU0ZUL8_9ACTN|nr:type II restriction endonuclease [Phytohabitans sp. ZYX-F-186]MDQ7910741.1 type II restriction endonuclease [Phytohabitans sp. ZYX-F-186]